MQLTEAFGPKATSPGNSNFVPRLCMDGVLVNSTYDIYQEHLQQHIRHWLTWFATRHIPDLPPVAPVAENSIPYQVAALSFHFPRLTATYSSKLCWF